MRINILGHSYNVTLDPCLLRDRSSAGECCANAQNIHLDSSVPDDRKEGTFIHEVIEALNYELELGLEHPNITRLETGIYQFIKANGGAEWLSGLVKKIK